jgi:hypothetical protein
MNRTLIALAAVAALAAMAEAPAQDSAKPVTVDKAKRTVSVEAKIAPRKLPHLDQVYPIEVVACWAHPKGKKAHETVVTIDCNPSEVHKGLEELGLKPGKPAKGEGATPDGPEVNVFLDVPGPDGQPKRLSMDKVLLDPKSKKPLPKSVKFRFTGSVMSPVDPSKPDEKKYGADLTGTLIALFPVTDETALQTNLTMKEEKYLKLEVNAEVLPKAGTAVKLVFEVPMK